MELSQSLEKWKETQVAVQRSLDAVGLGLAGFKNHDRCAQHSHPFSMKQEKGMLEKLGYLSHSQIQNIMEAESSQCLSQNPAEMCGRTLCSAQRIDEIVDELKTLHKYCMNAVRYLEQFMMTDKNSSLEGTKIIPISAIDEEELLAVEAIHQYLSDIYTFVRARGEIPQKAFYSGNGQTLFILNDGIRIWLHSIWLIILRIQYSLALPSSLIQSLKI